MRKLALNVAHMSAWISCREVDHREQPCVHIDPGQQQSPRVDGCVRGWRAVDESLASMKSALRADVTQSTLLLRLTLGRRTSDELARPPA